MEPLNESQLKPDPIEQFAEWYGIAEQSPAIIYPNACCLSTIDPDGFPNGRMVLLKGFGESGFSFYTNTTSLKGRSLSATPKAALTFYWPTLYRQVRIQGETSIVSDEDADEYFRSRPRLSQLGAWASQQSTELPDRRVLEERVRELDERYRTEEIPRPAHWTGFLLNPRRIELWQERDGRLHDRFEYSRVQAGSWGRRRLYP